MKRRHTIAHRAVLAVLTVLATLSGCKVSLGAFTEGDTIGVDATSEAALIASLSAAELAAYQQALADPASGSSLTPTVLTTGAISPVADRRLMIYFANGVVDESTIATGLILYALTATADADGAYGRGDAFSPTVTVTSDGVGGCVVELVVDLSGTTVSNLLELWIGAGILTANGGTNKMNLDNDGTYGEAGEDDFVSYPVVVGAPVTAAGAQRLPRASLEPSSFSNPAAGGTTIDVAVGNSNGGAASITAESLAAGYAVEQWSAADETWIALAPTPSYDDAGTLTFTFDAGFAAGVLLRWTLNSNLVAESEAVCGYVHRFWYNADDPGVRDFYVFQGIVNSTFLADSTETAPTASSTTDLTSGFDWAATNQDFAISTDGGAATTVTLTATTGTLNQVVAEVNAALTTAGIDGDYTAQAWSSDGVGGNDSIRIAELSVTGSSHYITLVAGTTDALATLGLEAGSYVGTDAWTGAQTDGADIAGLARSTLTRTTDEERRWVELRFDGSLEASTVTPDSVKIIRTTVEAGTGLEAGTAVEWEAGSASAQGDDRVRIVLPVTFEGDGSYMLRIYPTVTDADGVPYADTSVAGTRDGNPGITTSTAIGSKADAPYWESAAWSWN